MIKLKFIKIKLKIMKRLNMSIAQTILCSKKYKTEKVRF